MTKFTYLTSKEHSSKIFWDFAKKTSIPRILEEKSSENPEIKQTNQNPNEHVD